MHTMHRRSFLAGAVAGLTGALAHGAVSAPRRPERRVIFLWLAGGSSQFETWDPKPGRDTGGPFRSIATTVPGYRVCELMPKLAARMNDLTVIRSLNTGISEHEQAADLISTGRPREPALEYPEIGIVLATVGLDGLLRSMTNRLLRSSKSSSYWSPVSAMSVPDASTTKKSRASRQSQPSNVFALSRLPSVLATCSSSR